MNLNTFPTKGNLILAKNSLALASQGYELMDKKRNILLRELMGLIDQAKDIQAEIDTTFTEAYKALQKANIELGIGFIQDIAGTIPVDDTIRIKTRSIMGTEIPLVQHEPVPLTPGYAFLSTSPALDEARMHFEKVKELTVKLSMALGGLSKGTTPLEMAAAYGTIGNSGKYNAPTAIIKIVDRNGKVIFEHKQETKTVVDAKAAYQTVDIMRDVFVDGTAGGAGIGRPAAGKTGTTDDYKDAWFVGFTPNLSAAVWIGDDNGRPLDYMYGSGAPLSIWHEFMVNALANVPI